MTPSELIAHKEALRHINHNVLELCDTKGISDEEYKDYCDYCYNPKYKMYASMSYTDVAECNYTICGKCLLSYRNKNKIFNEYNYKDNK